MRFKKVEVVLPFMLVSSASADMMLRLSDSVLLWNGGVAWNNGNGWYGQGWDHFPGVNPPWNPIVPDAPPPQPPTVVQVTPQPMQRCAPVPPAPVEMSLGCNGEAIPVQIRW
jgi:hypothetical protein